MPCGAQGQTVSNKQDLVLQTKQKQNLDNEPWLDMQSRSSCVRRIEEQGQTRLFTLRRQRRRLTWQPCRFCKPACVSQASSQAGAPFLLAFCFCKTLLCSSCCLVFRQRSFHAECRHIVFDLHFNWNTSLPHLGECCHKHHRHSTNARVGSQR
jgi:hypothetical protein